MRTTVEGLVDGVVRTLVEAVLPDLTTPYARGQLYAAVDVLKNLRDRVEPRADLAAAECASAVAALERTITALAARPAAAAAIGTALAAAPDGPPLARVAALRAALVAALNAIAALPDDADARAARAPILEHLGGQIMRDVAVLKPSMLGEISRG